MRPQKIGIIGGGPSELIDELGFSAIPMGGTAVVLGERIVKSEADVSREFGDAADRALTGHYDPVGREAAS